jgi:hypothetical protein
MLLLFIPVVFFVYVGFFVLVFFLLSWTKFFYFALDCLVCPRPFDSRIDGRTSNFVDGWTQLSLDPLVLSTIFSGFKLDFFGNPPFQRHAPSNATMDALQSSLCDEEVDTLITKVQWSKQDRKQVT